jgi:arylformamidase
MAFDSLPDLGQLLMPGAAEYAEKALAMSRAVADSDRTALDIPYGRDAFQKLDVYLPNQEPVSKLPVLIFFHGGAWRHGHKEWMGFMAPPILAIPGIFISPNYRLVPHHKYPAALEDAVDVLLWVYRNISSYGGDPDAIFIGGHSAGGHIAALAAVRRDLMTKKGLPADLIKGCFVQSASLSLDLASIEPGSMREKIVRQILAQESDGREGSVITHINGSGPPFFISHGSKDLPNIPGESAEVMAKMKEVGWPVKGYIFDQLSHFETNLECTKPQSPWIQTVVAWMRSPGLNLS